MDIRSISPLRVSQNGGRWTFQVDYTATFRQDEVNAGFTFADNARLMEEDTSDDDIVVNWLGEEPWVPTGTEDRWTWTISASGDDVDTELGGEEIYIQLGLRNLTTGAPGLTRKSPIVQVSPG